MRSTIAACLFCTVVVIGVGIAQAELHPTGMIYEELEKIAPDHEVKTVLPAPGVPDYHRVFRVDLSHEMPPVGNQGGQGSCASWATTYYHRTHLEYIERHWSLTDPNHQFSPAFTYNQINGGGDYGSGFTNNFGLMCDQGCASLVDCPYRDNDPLSWPTEQAYINAIPFRCKTWHWAWVRDSSGIGIIKQLLNNGFSSCLAIWVWGNFDNIHLYNYTYCAADRTGSNRGGHLITICGYDDTLTTNDGPGAFRCVNSWGSGWGQAGFFWMSYAAAMDLYLSMQQVGWMEDTIGYEPKMLGRVRINHPARDRVGITFLVGKREVPLWFYDYRTWRWPRTDRPFPATNLVFDMTGGADYIENLETDSAFVCCYDDLPDGKEGEIVYASVQYLPWANIIRSRDTPLAIPDTWVQVYALSRMKRYDPDVGVVEGPTPTGVLDSGQTVVPKTKVRNFGQAAATFPVVMRIGSTYCDTQYVSNLAQLDTCRVSFRAWTAPTRGTFALRCTTMLVGDQYPDNDCEDGSVRVRVRDCALTAILSPPDTVDTGCVIIPQIRITNYGTEEEVVRAVFRIPGDNYARGGQKNVPAGAETTLTFPTWRSRNEGTHIACCTLTVNGDVHLENNDLFKYVTVKAGAGIAEHGLVPHASHLTLEAETNPFRTAVSLRVVANSPTELRIYDACGNLVRTIRTASQEPLAATSITWDGRNATGAIVPAGAYFCRLEASGRQVTISLLKLD
ncbi:MAG: FlgD immunoglobulin-like domain containing protein [candidate division WOR-3 bacterium]